MNNILRISKLHLLILAAGILCGDWVALGQTGNAAVEESAFGISRNIELPRTRTSSYDSFDAAANSSSDSPYIQTLTDEWSRTESENGAEVIFSRSYKIPYLWTDRQQFLEVERIGAAYRIRVNGSEAGRNAAGEDTAEFDITRQSKEGVNRLEIVVEKEYPESVLVGGAKSVTPSGISARIVSQPRIRVRDVALKTKVDHKQATVELGAIVKTHLLNRKNIKVFYTLIDPLGNKIAGGSRDAEFGMRGEDTVRFVANVAEARLWSHEAPELYTVVFSTMDEGRHREFVAYRVGLRRVDMKNGELMVNGYPAPLRFTELDVSQAMDVEQKLADIKNNGYTAVKIKGGTAPHHVLEVCDKVGLYVCNQASIDSDGRTADDPQKTAAYVERVTRMYHTSKNHASAAMFSVAENATNGYNLYESYLALKALESNRPIVCAGGGGEWNTDMVTREVAQTHPKSVNGRLVADFSQLPLPQVGGGVELIGVDTNRGKFSAKNTLYMSGIEHARVDYVVRKGKKVIHQGSTGIFNLAPQSEHGFEVGYGDAKRGKLSVELKLVELEYLIKPGKDSATAGQATEGGAEPLSVNTVYVNRLTFKL